MNKDDVKSIVNSEMKKFAVDTLDKEVAKLLKTNGTASRNAMIAAIKDSLESVYKTFWTKREFWRNDIH